MFGVVVYVALLGILTYLSLRKPWLALVAIMAMFGLEQWGQIHLAFLRTNSAFTNIYILVLVGYAAFLSFKRGAFEFRFNRKRNQVRFLATILFVYALVSLWWTPMDADAPTLWTSAAPYLFAGILLAPLLIGKLSDLEEVHQAFIFYVGALMLLLAYVPEWGARSMMIANPDGGDEKIQLPLALSQLSGYLLLVASIYLKKTPIRLAWFAAIAIGGLTVAVLSASRGPLIFSIACLVLVAPLIWPNFTIKHVAMLMVGGVAISGVALIVFTQLDAFSHRWTIDQLFDDVEQRLEFSRVVLSAWMDTDLGVIVGLGNSASFSPDILGIYPHIVPLEVLAEEGFIGFILFSLFLFHAISMGLRIRGLQHIPDGARRAFVANYGCSIFTILLCLKQGSLISSPDMFMFAILGEKYLFLLNRENLRNKRLSGLKSQLSVPFRSPAAT